MSSPKLGVSILDEMENVQGGQVPQAPLSADSFPVGNLTRSTDADKIFIHVHMLPLKMKRRLKALKKLQLQCTHIEAKFYEEVHKLECNFNKFYSELYAKREQIVNGKYEPTDDECDFNDGLTEEVPNYKLDSWSSPELMKLDPNAPGIPLFWLGIFKSVAILNDMVQLHDELILKHLEDIKVKLLEKDPMGFILEFHFSENPFFTNKVLTKEYFMKCVPDENDPFGFEGPEIYKCKGCSINWKTGKDITVKIIKKKQKHKSKGAVRTVTKVVKNDSFFNFFSPPVVNEGCENELDEETQALLTSDFEIGHYIRERIVPNAVLYYTGEALDDEEEEYDDDDDDDDDDDSEDLSSESDNDSEVYQRSEGDTNPAEGNTNPAEQNHPPDCKQQ